PENRRVVQAYEQVAGLIMGHVVHDDELVRNIVVHQDGIEAAIRVLRAIVGQDHDGHGDLRSAAESQPRFERAKELCEGFSDLHGRQRTGAGRFGSSLSAVPACGAAREGPHAIRLLNGRAPGAAPPPRQREQIYPASVIEALGVIWEAAGYPWSVPLWLPWL